MLRYRECPAIEYGGIAEQFADLFLEPGVEFGNDILVYEEGHFIDWSFTSCHGIRSGRFRFLFTLGFLACRCFLLRLLACLDSGHRDSDVVGSCYWSREIGAVEIIDRQ